jgi:hypothetical protein
MKSRPAEPSLDSVLDTISKEPASALSQSTREELYAIEQEIDNLTQKDRDTAAAYESLNEAWEALNSDRIVDAGSLAEKARTLAEHAPMKDEFKKEPTYITRRGDNFWKIARQELDDAKLWYLVWRYNEKKFPDFDLIYSGVELRIPPRDWVPDKKGPPPNWNEPNARLGL